MTTARAPELEPQPDVRTIADLPFHVMGRYQKPLLVGRVRGGAIEGASSKELFEQIRDVSLGLSSLGMLPGDRVAIVSESRPEWLVTDLAIVAGGGVTVPIYPTLSAGQARYILNDSGARIVVVSTRLQLQKIQEVRHQLPMLQALVAIEPGPASSPSVFSFEDVAARGHARMMSEWGAGKAFRDGARQITPDQLATIIYTSGTTGDPKGVMLTHHNLASNMLAGSEALDVHQEDVALSFLPLSHAFERMVSYIYLFCGVTVVFAESFDTIPRDISLVRPTIFTGVPRLYEKMHARVLEKGQSGSAAKAKLFRWAAGIAAARGHALLAGRQPSPLLALQAAFADRLAFSKIREGVGGRLRFVVSGSAPLPVAIAEFFHGVGIRIIEGYGLTETAPVLTVNPIDAPRAGTVGKPVRDVEVRIAEDGEILARGPNIMAGYYNLPQATAETITDGWLHTGDIGAIDADGYLSITDRKKDLLVTSGGKKIAPQPIEHVLKRSPLVSEAVVLGDRRRYAVALIVPEFGALERRLKDLGRPPGEDREALVVRSDVLALYQEIVDGLNAELSQFERIKRVAVLPREFSIETGELTPSLKVKRKVVEERWRDVIEELYRDK